jgi:RimJ/RimL family protein N-acetyltransferase
MVRLEPLGEADCARFLEWAIADYAEAQVTAGAWPAERAHEMAREAFESLLPEGFSTPGHSFRSVVDDQQGSQVGNLWFGERGAGEGRYAVVYEFMVREECRRQGYGTAALRALEQEVRELGLDRIVLHVFGHNHAARALYAKAGYVERNVTMVRWISRAGEEGAQGS